MTGTCEYCDGEWYTNARTLGFRGCCRKMEEELAEQSACEADNRYDAWKDREIDEAGWAPVAEEPKTDSASDGLKGERE